REILRLHGGASRGTGRKRKKAAVPLRMTRLAAADFLGGALELGWGRRGGEGVEDGSFAVWGDRGCGRGGFGGVVGGRAGPALARDGDIVEEWDAVKPPPKPELKPVTLQASTTALLILDLTKRGGCGTRPRCAASVPSVKRLQDSARAAGVMLFYTLGSPDE